MKGAVSKNLPPRPRCMLSAESADAAVNHRAATAPTGRTGLLGLVRLVRLAGLLLGLAELVGGQLLALHVLGVRLDHLGRRLERALADGNHDLDCRLFGGQLAGHNLTTSRYTMCRAMFTDEATRASGKLLMMASTAAIRSSSSTSWCADSHNNWLGERRLNSLAIFIIPFFLCVA